MQDKDMITTLTGLILICFEMACASSPYPGQLCTQYGWIIARPDEVVR